MMKLERARRLSVPLVVTKLARHDRRVPAVAVIEPGPMAAEGWDGE
jgi:hypothetical protein